MNRLMSATTEEKLALDVGELQNAFTSSMVRSPIFFVEKFPHFVHGFWVPYFDICLIKLDLVAFLDEKKVI